MRVKIYCHSCKGLGKVPEQAYPSHEKVMVICPECNGEKWVYVDVEE